MNFKGEKKLWLTLLKKYYEEYSAIDFPEIYSKNYKKKFECGVMKFIVRSPELENGFFVISGHYVFKDM